MVKAQASQQRKAGGRSRVRMGVALSATEIRAADVRPRGTKLAAAHGWSAALEAPDLSTGKWPSLAKALAEMAGAVGVTDGSLLIALLPPLTEVRGLQLPPLRDDELHRLLSRNAPRYFLNAREPQIVGAASSRRRSGGKAGSVVGAAASARLVAMIENAAREAGWRIDAIVPAEAGWRSAALTLWPTLAKGVSHLLVNSTDRTDVLRLESGQLAGVRRFRAGAADVDLIADLVSSTRDNGTMPRVAAIGAPGHRDALTNALSESGAVVISPPHDWLANADDPALIAASFVGPNEDLALRTEAALAARAQRFRFATYVVAVAAVLLFVAAAWIELEGVRREIAAVRAARSEIQPALRETLVDRASVDATHAKLVELIDAEREAPRWGRVIAAVTGHLDPDAHIVRFTARGDTLNLEGRAVSAGPIIDALSYMPGFANFRSADQVQRDVQRSGEALDRWSATMQLIPPASPRPAASRMAPLPPPRGARAGGAR